MPFAEANFALAALTEEDHSRPLYVPPVDRVAAFGEKRVSCPHCDRRFEKAAAERHIPFCREKASRLPEKGVLRRAVSYERRRPGSATRGRPGRPRGESPRAPEATQATTARPMPQNDEPKAGAMSELRPMSS